MSELFDFAMLRTPLLAFFLLASATVVTARDRPIFSDVTPYAIDLEAELVDRKGAKTTVGNLLGGEPAIVHVWATWCAPCREELPELAAFIEHPGNQALAERLLAISLDSADSDRVFGFLDDLALTGLPSWHVLDSRRQLSASLRLRGMPATYIVDHEGQIIAFRAGPLDWTSSDTASQLEDMLGLP